MSATICRTTSPTVHNSVTVSQLHAERAYYVARARIMRAEARETESARERAGCLDTAFLFDSAAARAERAILQLLARARAEMASRPIR